MNQFFILDLFKWIDTLFGLQKNKIVKEGELNAIDEFKIEFDA